VTEKYGAKGRITYIAACAMQYTSTLIHKDPQFEALAGQIALEALPYKRS
jgi:hypothetical protein